MVLIFSYNSTFGATKKKFVWQEFALNKLESESWPSIGDIGIDFMKPDYIERFSKGLDVGRGRFPPAEHQPPDRPPPAPDVDTSSANSVQTPLQSFADAISGLGGSLAQAVVQRNQQTATSLSTVSHMTIRICRPDLDGTIELSTEEGTSNQFFVDVEVPINRSTTLQHAYDKDVVKNSVRIFKDKQCVISKRQEYLFDDFIM